MAFSVATNEHLIRSNVWDPQLKRVFEDELIGNRWVRMLPYWGGGAINIPSIGQYQSRDYTEGQQVIYDAADTGNFTFTPTEYKSAATYITNKMKQDTFYMNELMSTFVPGHARALQVAMEIDMLATLPSAQTTAATNAINTARHRWVGSGTNETFSVLDFALAKYSFQKANVPMAMVAIVDPSVEYALSTQTNIVNGMSPIWGPIVKTGISTGMRFSTTIFGVDIYVSNNLKVNTASEAISGVTAAAGVNNIIMSVSQDALPLIGTIMQAPKVDSSYNKDFQREEFVTTCRYDYAVIRPESYCIVVTDTDQVT